MDEAMRVYLSCKRCGKRRSFIWTDARIPNAEKALLEGWSSDGKDVYCKDCAGWFEEVSDKAALDVICKVLWGQMPRRRKS